MRPALFLDRDGIIIHDSGYVREATKVALVPEIADLILRAQKSNWKVVVITNQSGLGRGWISMANYQAVSERMIELLEPHQAKPDHIYFCPFYEPESPGPEELRGPRFQSRGVPQSGSWDKTWRKPGAGMMLQAAKDHGLDLASSVFVGDRATDLIAGCLARVARTYMYAPPNEQTERETQEIDVWRPRLHELSGGKLDAHNLHPLFIQSFNEVQLA